MDPGRKPGPRLDREGVLPMTQAIDLAEALEEFQRVDAETKANFVIILGIMEAAKALGRGDLPPDSLYDVIASGLTLSRSVTLREFFRFSLKKFKPEDAASLIVEGHKVSTKEATKAVREFNNLVTGLLEPKPEGPHP